ncbi:MAG TPA: hypothetical protein VIL01_09275 [Thermomicrobiales bacterium]
MGLREIWSRIIGLRDWELERKYLHNTEEDETPPPGVVPGVSLDTGEGRRPAQRIADPGSPQYDEWEGIDPGH